MQSTIFISMSLWKYSNGMFSDSYKDKYRELTALIIKSHPPEKIYIDPVQSLKALQRKVEKLLEWIHERLGYEDDDWQQWLKALEEGDDKPSYLSDAGYGFLKDRNFDTLMVDPPEILEGSDDAT